MVGNAVKNPDLRASLIVAKKSIAEYWSMPSICLMYSNARRLKRIK
jgi:hypothetical protein